MAIFKDFISLKEAAEISGYHPDYIGALIRSHKIKGRKNGKNWFVSKTEVQEYFMTKHYMSVRKVFFSTKTLFFLLLLVVAFVAIVSVIPAVFDEHISSSSISTSSQNNVVKENLTDDVSPQDINAQFAQ